MVLCLYKKYNSHVKMNDRINSKDLPALWEVLREKHKKTKSTTKHMHAYTMYHN